MLNIFEKLEKAFNKLFFKLIDLFISLVKRLLPRKTIYKIEDLHHETIYKWARFKENNVKRRKKLIENTKLKKDQIFNYIQQAQKKEYKDKINQKKENVKRFFKETTIKQYIKYFITFLLFLKSKILNLLGRFSPKMIKLTFATLAVVLFATSAIMNQGRYIWLKENPIRVPARVEDFKDKPVYYNRNAKTMIIRNVRIPIIIKNVREISSITMEFSVRTTTRFAKIFLEEKEHIVKDHLFMNLQPIVSDFPIKEEGKRVLKEKIQVELNNLLDTNKVEGDVDMVRVLYIIGS